MTREFLGSVTVQRSSIVSVLLENTVNEIIAHAHWPSFGTNFRTTRGLATESAPCKKLGNLFIRRAQWKLRKSPIGHCETSPRDGSGGGAHFEATFVSPTALRHSLV